MSKEVKHPPAHEDTLGYHAVALGDLALVHDPQMHYDREVDMRYTYLEPIRSEWRNMHIVDKRRLSRWTIDSMPPFQRYQFDRSSAPTVPDWLIASEEEAPVKTIEDANRRHEKRKAEDQRLLNFLQYHNHITAERQKDPEFLREVERYSALWLHGVQAGVEEERFDPSALARAERLDDIKVYLGDYPSLKQRAALGGDRGGYHKVGSSQIVVDHWMYELSVPHELNHALLEGRNPEQRDSLTTTWLNEALTENSAMIMRAQAGEGIIESEAYLTERQMLSWMITEAQTRGIELTMNEFTLAYSSEGETRAERITQIEKKVSQLFGGCEGVITEIQQEIKVASKDQQKYPLKPLPPVSPAMIGWQKMQNLLAETNPNPSHIKVVA